MQKFYIVATPIGNLEDITLRALRVLRKADVVFAEDTRVTRKLLAHYDIHKPIIAFHEYSKPREIERLLEILASGKSAALVTCAGTPGISDPGPRLIHAVLERFGEEIAIVPIPGPSAVAAIASLSAVPMDEFHFFGYPPVKKGRKTFFQDVKENAFPGILYESPHRIQRTLTDLLNAIGSTRNIVIGRELTKLFETVVRGTLAEIAGKFGNKKGRGEYVILVEPEKRKRALD